MQSHHGSLESNVCGAQSPKFAGVRCELPQGHEGQHAHDPTGEYEIPALQHQWSDSETRWDDGPR